MGSEIEKVSFMRQPVHLSLGNRRNFYNTVDGKMGSEMKVSFIRQSMY